MNTMTDVCSSIARVLRALLLVGSCFAAEAQAQQQPPAQVPTPTTNPPPGVPAQPAPNPATQPPKTGAGQPPVSSQASGAPAAQPTQNAPSTPATPPARTQAGQPAQSAATQAAPASTPPSAPVVSGGGGAPHGALAMDRQLAMLGPWIGNQPQVQRPSWTSPGLWSAILPKDNGQPTAQQVALGRKLFFDPRLSRDGSVACA